MTANVLQTMAPKRGRSRQMSTCACSVSSRRCAVIAVLPRATSPSIALGITAARLCPSPRLLLPTRRAAVHEAAAHEAAAHGAAAHGAVLLLSRQALALALAAQRKRRQKSNSEAHGEGGGSSVRDALRVCQNAQQCDCEGSDQEMTPLRTRITISIAVHQHDALVSLVPASPLPICAEQRRVHLLILPIAPQRPPLAGQPIVSPYVSC